MHPVVTKIVEINLEYETLIEDIRGLIYEPEGNIDKGVFDGMLQIYESKDFAYSTQQSDVEKLSGLIARCETEDEVLAAIAAMETTGTKNDTRE